MARGELEALETTERLPVTLPAEFGVKRQTEGEALPRDQGEWQAQSTYAKGSAGKIGLGDAHAGVAGIGQRCRLSGAVTDLHAAKADARRSWLQHTSRTYTCSRERDGEWRIGINVRVFG